jgi:hypothetical protein
MDKKEVFSAFLFGYFFGLVSNDVYDYIKTYIEKKPDVTPVVIDCSLKNSCVPEAMLHPKFRGLEYEQAMFPEYSSGQYTGFMN